jgi:hypothetical protein
MVLVLVLVLSPQINSIVDFGIMGGITNLTKSSLKSNTPRYGAYDTSKPITEILFADISSNYAAQLVAYLPWKEFEIMTCKEIQEFDFATAPQDTWMSFIFVNTLEKSTTIYQIFPSLQLKDRFCFHSYQKVRQIN